MSEHSETHRLPHREQLLLRLLHDCFGDLDTPALALLREQMEWVEVAGGQTLMEQGQPGDAMYVSVSGRLRAYVSDDSGRQRMVREMSRGQVVGEMSLFSGEPRSATVVAIRESVLVRLSKSAFESFITAQPGVTAVLTRLAAPLRGLGRVRVIHAAALPAELAPHELSLADDGPELNRRVALVLDEIESNTEFVRLVAEILVLLHGPEPLAAGQVTRWLQRRCVADHVHVRQEEERDFQRLARLQSRTAVGLVLVGGGARGLAHLGVMQALAAADRPLPEAEAIAQRALAVNPTGDLNPFLVISLIRGQRLSRLVRGAIRELLGRKPRLEDLWKPCCCVATNYSQAREELLRDGPLAEAVLASAAIPGALPPVVRNGELLCDDVSFNNFPVAAMQSRRGIGTVIGVDLTVSRPRQLEMTHMPNWWNLALDRLRPRRQRRYKLPSLSACLLNVTTLYSASRREQALAGVDLFFNPSLARVGMLAWHRFDDIVAQGLEHGREVLAAADPQLLARVGAQKVAS